LTDSDWQVRRAAARSLGGAIRGHVAIEETRIATKALIGTLRDSRPDVRLAAVESIGELYEAPWMRPLAGESVGPDVAGAVSELEHALHDSVPEVRGKAARSLGMIGPEIGAHPGPITDALENDPDVAVRLDAIYALSKGWSDDAFLDPLLLRRLKAAPKQEERFAIVWALVRDRATPPHVATLLSLMNALPDDDHRVRWNISVALARLGPAARAALPALDRVARAQLRELRQPFTAAHAIASIDSTSPEAQALLEPLVDTLRAAPEGWQRFQAALALGQFGPRAVTAVPSLRAALKSDSADVRQRAASVLGQIGRAAITAAPDLQACARSDTDEGVRRVAQEALDMVNRE
jgi:HEAT repeat protein